ncbi:MAG: regulatory protein RecX [Chloroflexi bacterium]|nr:regulatory protein RecX [Chloroflexota bacterium]
MNEEDSDSDQMRRASASAIRHLARRPRTESEVRTHLRRKFPHDIIEQVVADLRERSLIDDAEFARLWTESRLRTKPRSAWLVKRELMSKGVASDLAEQAVSDFDDSENAYRAASDYSRRLDRADYETFHRRLFGYMGRRGFSASVSRSVISSLWRDREQSEVRR